MRELNVYHHELRPNEYAEFYLKYEADKVIADLEESHKMEVEQLLMEIVGLKDKTRMHDFFWEGCGFKRRGFKNSIEVSEAYDFLEEENAQLKESIAVYQRNEKLDIREIRHQKYKRCLAMAKWCDAMKYYFNESGFFDVYANERMVFYERWHNRWFKIAEQFKDEEAK